MCGDGRADDFADFEPAPERRRGVPDRARALGARRAGVGAWLDAGPELPVDGGRRVVGAEDRQPRMAARRARAAERGDALGRGAGRRRVCGAGAGGRVGRVRDRAHRRARRATGHVGRGRRDRRPGLHRAGALARARAPRRPQRGGARRLRPRRARPRAAVGHAPRARGDPGRRRRWWRARRLLVARVLAAWDAVAARADALVTQPIHNDATDYNVVARDGVEPSGLLDFGDTLRQIWWVRDPVCAAVSAVGHALEDPLEPALAVLAGYHAETPLEEAEADVFWGLVLARAAVCALSGNRAGAAVAGQRADRARRRRGLGDPAGGRWDPAGAGASCRANGLRNTHRAPMARRWRGRWPAHAACRCSTPRSRRSTSRPRPRACLRGMARAGPARGHRGRPDRPAGRAAPAAQRAEHARAGDLPRRRPLRRPAPPCGPRSPGPSPSCTRRNSSSACPVHGTTVHVRLAGVEPSVATGDAIAAGDVDAHVAAAGDGSSRPDVHVQVGAAPGKLRVGHARAGGMAGALPRPVPAHRRGCRGARGSARRRRATSAGAGTSPTPSGSTTTHRRRSSAAGATTSTTPTAAPTSTRSTTSRWSATPTPASPPRRRAASGCSTTSASSTTS